MPSGGFSLDPAQAKCDFLDDLEARGVKPRQLAMIDTIIEKLAEPSYKWPEVNEYATTLVGQKEPRWFYRALAQEDRERLEAIALHMRRTRYGRELAEIDEVLLDAAKAGSERHINLAYRRFEGWSPNGGSDNGGDKKSKVSVTVSTGIDRAPAEGKSAGNGVSTAPVPGEDPQEP